MLKMNSLYFLTVVLSLTESVFCISRSQPKAVTENGVAVGRYATSHYGKTFMSFEGIPYARPPLGENRFKEPQRLTDAWIGEWNATTLGSPCIQRDHFTRDRNSDGSIKFHILGDEDCLFLNVYTQENGPKNKDVVVMIHGGAFMFGTGNWYGPEYLMERDDIVYVNLNYRLGPLGFLSTGDSVVPGNNGLKDQVAALEWVQRNIAAFGGDPNKVTIIGLSAGGASVHYQFLSPLSNNLFKRGYSYSGSALCPWALVTDGPQKAKQLALNLGCPTDDHNTMVNCLRKRPAKKLIEQIENFQSWLFNPYTVFGPVVEVQSSRSFIDQHPRDLLKSGKVKNLPWITGVTAEDGLYPVADFIEDERLLNQLRERWREISPKLLFFKESSSSDVAQKIKKAYLDGEEISKATVPQIIQMASDRLFVGPGVEAAALQAKVNSEPVYLYMYRHIGQRSISSFMSDTSTIFGACHGDDVAYIVKFGGMDTHISSDDKAMADYIGNILFSFIKTGVPKTSVQWDRVSKHSKDKVTYLNIISPYKAELRTDSDIGNLHLISEIFGDNKWHKDEL